eukprot:gene13484-18092_t
MGKEESRNQNTFSYKLLYFFLFSGYGILFPYFPVFYESLLMSKAQIGLLCMIPNFTNFLIGPIFSILCDTWNAHCELIISSLIVSTAFTYGGLYIESFNWMLVNVLIGSSIRAPITSQIDALVISSLTEKNNYGSMRLWGAISYGIFSFVGGILTSKPATEPIHTQNNTEAQDQFRYSFFLNSIFSFIAGFIILYLVQFHSLQHQHNITDVQPKDNNLGESTNDSDIETSENHEINQKKSVVHDLFLVFYSNPLVLIFAIVIFLSGIGSGIIDSFLFLRLKELGGSGLVMGVSRFITCAAEVPMFQIAGKLQKKYGTWLVLTITQIAFIIRFTYYSNLTTPWAVLPCEILHGLTFATMWSVACTYANEISPPSCHSTMQAILESLHWGFGSGMGALIGGFAYDSFGAVRLFQASAIMSTFSTLLACGVCFYFTQFSSSKSNQLNQSNDFLKEQKMNISTSDSIQIHSKRQNNGFIELQQND